VYCREETRAPQAPVAGNDAETKWAWIKRPIFFSRLVADSRAMYQLGALAVLAIKRPMDKIRRVFSEPQGRGFSLLESWGIDRATEVVWLNRKREKCESATFLLARVYCPISIAAPALQMHSICTHFREDLYQIFFRPLFESCSFCCNKCLTLNIFQRLFVI
jgi:hypothetical protein